MQAHLFATVESVSDSVNLAAYPGLTYAPDHWGAGVRFAHNGADVKEVARYGDTIRGTCESIDAMAKRIGVSFADVCDALKFLRDQGAI